jgi:hypothetical protein
MTCRRALAALAVALSITAPTSSSADPLLKSAYESFDTGERQDIKAPLQSSPRSVAIGDLNEDGRPDLVVAAPSNNAWEDSATVICVHLANPFPQTVQPPYLPAARYPSDTGPWSVAMADMNRDGHLDVITTNVRHNTASVFLGDGTGKLVVRTDTPVGVSPWFVAVGDLNGDSNPDVVTTNLSANTISVLMGLGDGSLGPKTDYATGEQPLYLAIARLNADSAPDIVVVNSDDTFISLYLNDGSGGFGNRTDIDVGGNPSSVAAGLLNGDGFVDLVVGGSDVVGGGGTYWLSVRLGTGTGTFLPGTNHVVPYYVFSTILADLNGDTKLDVAASVGGGLTGDQDIAILLGDGAGGLAAPAYYDAGMIVRGIACADLDGDGDRDLAVANSGPSIAFADPSHTVSILRNNGPGTFGTGISQDPELSPTQSVSADFNRDGILDVAVTGAAPFGVKIFLGIGDGTFAAPTFLALPDSGLSIGSADLNRNGTADLVVGTASSIYVFLGVGNGNFLSGTVVAGAQGFDGELGDFNFDGKPDLVTFSGSNVFVRLGLGTGAFVAPTTTAAPGAVRGVGVGDLDRNGRQDLVILTAAGISVRFGVGNGTFPTGTTYLGNHSFNGKPVIADLNMDGKPDVAASDNGDTGIATVGMAVLLGTGTGTLTPGLTFPMLDIPIAAAAADMNRDGKLDLLGMNTGSFRPGTVAVLEGNGSGTFSAQTDYGAGTLAGRLLVGDYNRDGRPDVALTTQNAEAPPHLRVLRGNAPGTFGSFSAKVDYAGPTSEQAVAVADVNRDGRPDAIVIGPNGSFGRVGVCLGNGLGALGAPTYFNTAANPVAVAVGDLNLDASPDLAVACGSGYVSVLIGNGAGNFMPSPSGDVFLAGEIPSAIAIGDFYPDGIPDLATADEATNEVGLLMGGGGGDFSLTDLVLDELGPRAIAAADVNRDGQVDIITANHSSNDVTVLYNGNGVFGPFFTGPFVGLAPTAVAAGDFNRDGVPDLAVTHETTSVDQVAVLLGGGDGLSLMPAVNYPTPDIPQAVAVSDVDKDGVDDLVVVSRSANLVSVLMGTGTGTFAPRVDYATGTLPGGVAIGDLNLDGRPDILVSNATSANTSVLLNSGSVVTGVEAQVSAAPPTARLAQNVPNPFNPRTTIRFHLDVAEPARLMVFDVSGRRVATLIDRNLPAGDGRAEWDGRDTAGHAVASGVYFYRLEAPDFTDSRAMVLLR